MSISTLAVKFIANVKVAPDAEVKHASDTGKSGQPIQNCFGTDPIMSFGEQIDTRLPAVL